MNQMVIVFSVDFPLSHADKLNAKILFIVGCLIYFVIGSCLIYLMINQRRPFPIAVVDKNG